MRIDIDTLATFTTASSGAVLATVDLSGAEYAAIGVVISALAGSPTTVRIEAIPTDSLAGTNVFSDGDVFGSPDLTGAPVAAPKKVMISRVGASGAAKTAVLAEGFLLPPPLKYVNIVAGLSGGSAPTMTGTVIGFRFVR